MDNTGIKDTKGILGQLCTAYLICQYSQLNGLLQQ